MVLERLIRGSVDICRTRDDRYGKCMIGWDHMNGGLVGIRVMCRECSRWDHMDSSLAGIRVGWSERSRGSKKSGVCTGFVMDRCGSNCRLSGGYQQCFELINEMGMHLFFGF